MAKIHRKWVDLNYDNTNTSIRAEDIPYDATDSIKNKIDNLSSYQLKDSFTAGENLAQGDIVQLADDGKVYKAQGNLSETSDVFGIANSTALANAQIEIVLVGQVDFLPTGISAGQISSTELFLSTSTAGGATATQPTTGFIVPVGRTLPTDKFYFLPSSVILEPSETVYDGSYISKSFTAGQALVKGDIVQLEADGKVHKAQSNVISTSDVVGIVSTDSVAVDEAVDCILYGFCNFVPSGITSFSGGGEIIYLSDTTAGEASSTAGDVVVSCGYSLDTNSFLFSLAVAGGGGGAITGASEEKSYTYTVLTTDISAKQFTLQNTIENAQSLELIMLNGPSLVQGFDFQFNSPKYISWDGMQIDGLIEAGDKIRVKYEI